MIPEINEPVVQYGIDDTPTIADQAAKKGWQAQTFNFGKAEQKNTAFFNPGLCERDDGLWLIVRRAVFENELDFGKNDIWACKLNPDLTPHGGKLLKFPSSGQQEQFEDARCIKFGNKVFMFCCNFIWHGDGSWTGAHQVLGEFSIDYNDENNDWTGLNRYDLEIDGNGRSLDERTKHQKNWAPFIHENRLQLHFSTDPWSIIGFNQQNMADMTTYNSEGVKWAFGTMRGGTPPVLIDDLYWTFNHSSLPWTGRYRKYYMGAVAFESKPPFKPVYYTPKPLLAGSQKDFWSDRKPLVVFPGGSVIKDGIWTVVYGINDLRCGYVKIPHSDLLKLVEPISTDSVLLQKSEAPVKFHEYGKEGDALCPILDATTKDQGSNGTEKVQPSSVPTLKERRQAQAAKMREAKSLKRQNLDKSKLAGVKEKN